MPPGVIPPQAGGNPPAQPSNVSGGFTAADYPSTHAGWSAIRYSVNQSLPGALRQGIRSYAATYAALAATRKGR